MEISITETKERINQIINWLTKIKEKQTAVASLLVLAVAKIVQP